MNLSHWRRLENMARRDSFVEAAELILAFPKSARCITVRGEAILQEVVGGPQNDLIHLASHRPSALASAGPNR